jgi:cell division transport system permease protein
MVSGQPGVYSVIDQSALFESLFNILNKIQIATLGSAAILAIAAILLISTTIKLSALSRHKETSIMRLVGASNFFIQVPFVLEGIIAALIGTFLALGTLFCVLKFYLTSWFSDNLNILMGKISTTDVFFISPYLIIAAIVLAGLSAVLTLRKFTKI